MSLQKSLWRRSWSSASFLLVTRLLFQDGVPRVCLPGAGTYPQHWSQRLKTQLCDLPGKPSRQAGVWSLTKYILPHLSQSCSLWAVAAGLFMSPAWCGSWKPPPVYERDRFLGLLKWIISFFTGCVQILNTLLCLPKRPSISEIWQVSPNCESFLS